MEHSNKPYPKGKKSTMDIYRPTPWGTKENPRVDLRKSKSEALKKLTQKDIKKYHAGQKKLSNKNQENYDEYSGSNYKKL